MESFIASFYVPLPAREAYPLLYVPGYFLISLLPFLISNRAVGITISLPLLTALFIRQPSYTFGNSSDDYYNTATFAAILLWYIDFVLCTPREGHDAPRLINVTWVKEDEGRKVNRAWTDLTSTWQRVRWSARLMFAPHRGIGWNWEVKGVPLNECANFSRFKFTIVHLAWATYYYALSVVMLVLLGWSSIMRASVEEPKLGFDTEVFTYDALIGWSGAIWVWCRLCCAYDIVAAITIAVGIFAQRDWPPLMGDLNDAWSVRQMWSAVYHQTFRRMLSQPALHISRQLGLKKGSLASRYTQLYLTFALSCLFHQYQMFNVTRRDMGEFAFFMSQPVAITVEDFVHYVWRRVRGSERGDERFEIAVGACWTFIWFSFTLHWYIGGLLEAGVVRDWVFGSDPLVVGASLTPHVLEGLVK